jgi:hypothetical protein
MVSKIALIELFESQLQRSDTCVANVYIEGYVCKGLSFRDYGGTNIAELFKDDYTMGIVDFDGIFFLTFNSIKIKITEDEYQYLEKILLKKEKTDTLKRLKDLNKKDMELLNKVFSEKTKKETRKTIVEKIK